MYNRLTGRRAPLRHLQQLTLALGALVSVSSYARPDMTPLGPNIADSGSAFYHFSVTSFDSADGQRHYRVWTAVPDKAPPPSGYPVLWLLDGNSAMHHLSEPLLQQMSQGSPPVLIAVGYQTTLPFDQTARTLDYTPRREGTKGGVDLNHRGKEMGGSVPFRQLLIETIMPQVEKGLPLDPRQRALWGHSYGGLFVLDTWLAPSPFTRFFAASPSVGQGYFFLLAAMRKQAQQPVKHAPIQLMEGDGDPPRPGQKHAPDVLAEVQSTVKAMQAAGVPASYRLWPGLAHGQMFTASLEAALLEMSGPATNGDKTSALRPQK